MVFEKLSFNSVTTYQLKCYGRNYAVQYFIVQANTRKGKERVRLVGWLVDSLNLVMCRL